MREWKNKNLRVQCQFLIIAIFYVSKIISSFSSSYFRLPLNSVVLLDGVNVQPLQLHN